MRNAIPISSPTSRTFKRLLALKTARGIKRHSLTIVSGVRQVREVARDFPDRCEALILSRDHTPPTIPSLDVALRYLLPIGLFRQLDMFDTGEPLLMVRVPRFPRIEDRPWPLG